MNTIYDDVKAGRDVDIRALLDIIDGLRAAGEEIILLECTELSVIHHDLALADPTVVDSLDVLARRTVERTRLAVVQAWKSIERLLVVESSE